MLTPNGNFDMSGSPKIGSKNSRGAELSTPIFSIPYESSKVAVARWLALETICLCSCSNGIARS